MLRFVLTLAVGLALAGRASAVSIYTDPIYNVSEMTNVQYGTGQVNNGAGTANLLLDVYQPTVNPMFNIPTPAETPAIVLIHGGGFVSGDKGDMTPLAQAYAAYGYVVYSINYRMYGDLPPNSSPGPADNMTPPPPGYDTFPDLQLGDNAINAAVHDAQLAMGWVRDNAASYGVDPARVAIGGVSAGAITSLLEAYNNPSDHVAPTAVLDFLGSMYGTEGVIQSGASPAFIFHGDADTQVPFSGDVAVANQMTTVGVYHEFYIGQGIGHELDPFVFSLMYGNETLFQHNIDFLANHLVVPEPATWALLASGSLSALALRWLRSIRLAGGLRRPYGKQGCAC